MKRISTLLILLLITTVSHAVTIPNGNGIWIYDNQTNWKKQLTNLNRKATERAKIKYLFTYAGHFDINPRTHGVKFIRSGSDAKFYLDMEKKGMWVIPTVAAPVANGKFSHWSDAEYAKAAKVIADFIDKHQQFKGVQIDFEPFDKSQLPFYQALARDLEKHNRLLFIFVEAPKADKALFKAIEPNTIVIMSGYDLDYVGDNPNQPVPPDVYGGRLEKFVKRVDRLGKKYQRHYMVAIPAIATSYEWGSKTVTIDGKSVTYKNRFPMSGYLLAALKRVNKINNPFYVGYSVWALFSAGSEQMYKPVTMTDHEWSMLASDNHND